jgi:SAM-dependent MidA family methyltransferase
VPAGPADDRSLTERLAALIHATGPMPVAEFVEAALYDTDEGFYMTAGRSGRTGDFLTAPEVGPLFGAVIARAIDQWWADMGSPERIAVVDAGAGPGTLARSVQAAAPAVLRAGALRWISVERSPRQRALHPDLEWLTSLEAIPEIGGPTVVIANELLDNLAFDVVERGPDGWIDVLVDLDARGRFVTAPGGPAPSGGTLDLDVPVGTRVPVQTGARRFVDDIHRLVPEGRLVVLDYGADTETLARRPGLGWLRVHRRHDDRGDWLDAPGSRDITVDVATDQIAADHRVSWLGTQADFLRRYGIEQLVAAGRRLWLDRAHVGDLEALAGRSRVSEAEALLDPAGMGGFFVAEWII